MINENLQLPWWKKCTLSIEEASDYLGIGEKTLRCFIKEHPDEDFIIYNGTKVLIKRKNFERNIDDDMSVI